MTDDRDDAPPPEPAADRRSRRASARRSSRAAPASSGPGATARAEAGLQPEAAVRAENEVAIEARADGDGPTAAAGAPDIAVPETLEATGVVATGVEPTADATRTPPTGRAAASWSCPLLRLLDGEGRLGPASATLDDWHRCAAETPPSPLSERQQALVCLTEAHVDCPRYRRAAAPVPVPRTLPAERSGLSPATLAATLVLLMSFIAALSFVAVNGGISVPTPLPSADVAAATPSAPSSPAASPSAAPSERPSSSPAGSPSPSAATAGPSPSPTPTPPPSTRPSPSAPGPSPSSDRYLLLVACPGRPDCYRYTVRRGDNLTSIGLYFGVPFDTLLARNPWIRDPKRIRAGDVIEMPPPTR